MVFGVVSVALTGTFFYRQSEPVHSQPYVSRGAGRSRRSARGETSWRCSRWHLSYRRFWGNWPRLKIYAAVAAACTFLIFLVTRISESGILLYASLIHSSPAHLNLEPGCGGNHAAFPG